MTLPPLRPYQEECIETVTASEDPDKLINIFCGLGKSRIMFELLQGRYRKGLKFAVMSNLNLMRQFCADYLHGRLPYMPFCTLQDTEGVSEATTDAAMARDFMEQHEDGIIAVTYHSLELLTNEALGDFKPTVFFDESHNLQQETRKWAVTEPRFSQRLFFSATPSKNNGEPLFKYSYTEALEHEDEWGQPEPFAQDVRLHVGSYVDNGAGPHDNVELLIKTAVLTGNMRCLSFHSTVKGPDPDSVLNFAERCKAQLPIVAPGIKWRVETLYSDMPQRDRLRILQEFDATPDDEIFILCSCETISEGVDTKKCNLVAFIAAVRNYYKIVQKFGRAVRLQAHDRPATILLPFWVNPSQFTDTMTKEECDAVPRTLYAQGNPLFDFYAAIREDDPELLALFQDMYRGPQTKRLKHYAELCGDLPRLTWEEAVQEATGVETDDIATAARESNTTVEVHPRDGPVEQHEGAAAVEKSIVEMEKDRFVVVPKVVAPAPRENRVVYDSCSPVLMNVNFNEALGTAVLEYELRPELFEQRIQELKVFYAEHGIPKHKGKRGNEAILWNWIQARRCEKKKGVLTPEKIQRIETVFNDWWSWERFSFENKVEEVNAFYKKYGEPKRNGIRGKEASLAKWIARQRENQKKGVLTPEKIQLIETIFKDWWSWEPFEDTFKTTIQEVDAFYQKYGEPPKYKKKREKNEAFLCTWIRKRRCEKKKGVLTPEKIQLIETIFKDWWSWEPIEDAFETTIQEMDAFYQKYGEPPKSKGKREKNEGFLYSWIRTRVKYKKNGVLTFEKIKRIETVFKEWWNWGKASASASMDEDPASITEDGADSSLDSMEFVPPAEPEQQEERREKRPRDDGLDGMDKDALIAMIREQKRGREGYTAPNPVNKNEINTLFSRSLPRHRGAVLFLDHTDFKTATALQAAGVDPRDMIIPQRDRATFDTMRRDPVFGTSVILGDFNGILSQHTMPVRGIYADFTGPLKEAEAFIEACRRIHFVPHAVVAVTITLRNPEGGAEHVNQDIVKLSGLLNRELDTIAIDDPETGKTIWSLAYGHGAPMATVIQRRRN
jgi:superfamily II DNA or RNA helicase